MQILRTRLLLTYAVAAILAGSTAGYAQGQTKVDYGTSLRDGLAKENSRYSAITLRIGKERVDAQAQLARARNNCSGASGDAYTKCSKDAQSQYQMKARQINDEDIRERAEHEKNVMDIQHKWYDYQPCNRPDCVNRASDQRSDCSGGNCK